MYTEFPVINSSSSDSKESSTFSSLVCDFLWLSSSSALLLCSITSTTVTTFSSAPPPTSGSSSTSFSRRISLSGKAEDFVPNSTDLTSEMENGYEWEAPKVSGCQMKLDLIELSSNTGMYKVPLNLKKLSPPIFQNLKTFPTRKIYFSPVIVLQCKCLIQDSI